MLFKNTGDVNCDFDIAFRTDGETYGLAGTGGQSLPYTLFDSGRQHQRDAVHRRHSARPTEPTIHLIPGAQQLLHYAFMVDLTQLPTDGDFSQQLLVSAETADGQVLADTPVRAWRWNVAPSAVLSLRGAFRTGFAGGSRSSSVTLRRRARRSTMLELYVQSTKATSNT